MKRILFALLALAVTAIPAAAMQQSSVPTKFPVPWANAAGSQYVRTIPTTSQIGIQNCAASLPDGFPPLTFVPVGSGGCPPFGQDVNGILKQLSLWAQWQGAGAAPLYDASFQTSIGGYPSGATLSNASTPGCFWVSTVDNNVTDPDTGGAGWNASCPGGNLSAIGGTSTGTANAQIVSATPFVLTNGATINFIVGAGLNNNGTMTLNVNSTGAKTVFRLSQLGQSASVGGEVHAGARVQMQYDGTEWVCLSCGVSMVGEVKTFAGSTVPNGWVAADGTCYLTSGIYADLFSVLGTGIGSCGAGQFGVPDGRGTVMAGLDNQGTNGNAARMSSCGTNITRGGRCGAQNETVAQNQLPNTTIPIPANQGSHFHTVGPLTGGNGTGPGPGGAGAAGGAFAFNTNPAVLPAMVTASMNGGVTQQPLVTVQPTQFLVTMIKL